MRYQNWEDCRQHNFIYHSSWSWKIKIRMSDQGVLRKLPNLKLSIFHHVLLCVAKEIKKDFWNAIFKILVWGLCPMVFAASGCALMNYSLWYSGDHMGCQISNEVSHVQNNHCTIISLRPLL